ncbi:hypothetical protein CIN01S_04_01380 [Chryseobacterium indologenes NBRC 14944]|nr:hypothetical protein CIN01S_04_01380 [Chryseobacterium indologenes NBRC 14944]
MLSSANINTTIFNFFINNYKPPKAVFQSAKFTKKPKAYNKTNEGRLAQIEDSSMYS